MPATPSIVDVDTISSGWESIGPIVWGVTGGGRETGVLLPELEREPEPELIRLTDASESASCLLASDKGNEGWSGDRYICPT